MNDNRPLWQRQRDALRAEAATEDLFAGLEAVEAESAAEIAQLPIDELRSLAIAQEYLLVGREQLLAAIPPCPLHGEGCVPHALEWIAQVRKA
jgi:hypothetical protein